VIKRTASKEQAKDKIQDAVSLTINAALSYFLLELASKGNDMNTVGRKSQLVNGTENSITRGKSPPVIRLVFPFRSDGDYSVSSPDSISSLSLFKRRDTNN
jgi:hypothetical protein